MFSVRANFEHYYYQWGFVHMTNSLIKEDVHKVMSMSFEDLLHILKKDKFRLGRVKNYRGEEAKKFSEETFGNYNTVDLTAANFSLLTVNQALDSFEMSIDKNYISNFIEADGARTLFKATVLGAAEQFFNQALWVRRFVAGDLITFMPDNTGPFIHFGAYIGLIKSKEEDGQNVATITIAVMGYD